MHDPNQAPGGETDPANRVLPAVDAPETAAATTESFGTTTGGSNDPPGDGFDADRWARAARGLRTWLFLILALGAVSFAIQQQDSAGIAALAGLCVAAKAADFDVQWRPLYFLLAWIVPVAGCGMFVALGFALSQEGGGAGNAALVGLCFGGALASLLTLFRPFANALAQVWFHVPQTTHTQRLAARIVFIGLVIAVPLWFAVRVLFDSLADDIGSLIGGAGLGLGLVAYVMLAFASIGYMIQRDLRASLDRLGIRGVSAKQWGIVLAGTVALFALNSGADVIQNRWFHNLWLADQRINQAIGSALLPWEMLVLGLSAGIGEEITLRGALQPRLGLVWTSLLFAGFHVQYSWYGIGVIFLIGIFLGILRNRTNTSVAIGVHTLYDIVAVLSVPQAVPPTG